MLKIKILLFLNYSTEDGHDDKKKKKELLSFRERMSDS